MSRTREERRDHVGVHGDHASSRMRAKLVVLILFAGSLSACLPDPPTLWPRRKPAPKPDVTATAPAPPPARPPPPAALAVAIDIGGGYAGDFDPAFELASNAAFQASAGIGWRRGSRTVLLRGRIDYAGPEPTGVRAAAIGASFLTWHTIPLVDLPLELELGAGVGAFDRMAEAPHYGLDLFCSFGVPLRRERDLLLTGRISNIHSTTNVLSAILPPFGDQQLGTFVLALAWRR